MTLLLVLATVLVWRCQVKGHLVRAALWVRGAAWASPKPKGIFHLTLRRVHRTLQQQVQPQCSFSIPGPLKTRSLLSRILKICKQGKMCFFFFFLIYTLFEPFGKKNSISDSGALHISVQKGRKIKREIHCEGKAELYLFSPYVQDCSALPQSEEEWHKRRDCILVRETKLTCPGNSYAFSLLR